MGCASHYKIAFTSSVHRAVSVPGPGRHGMGVFMLIRTETGAGSRQTPGGGTTRSSDP